MSVVFDPHESVAGNVQVKEPRTLAASGPRFVFPLQGAFYTDSLEVWNGTAKLTESKDYYISHPYATGILRTARMMAGGIWIINPALRTVQLTYHPVGINIPTAAKYETERLKLSTVNPAERYFEDIIGDQQYFPPVDIQFDWENWCGEDAFMHALKGVAESLEYVDPAYDPSKANADLVGTMRHWLIELRRVYTEAPAHAHVKLKNNPHLEDYGWIGALKRNGLAANTDKAYGLTLAQLVLSVNNQLPTLTQITATKMLTTGGPITGPIITSDGLTKFSRGPNDTSYDSITKIDKGVSGSTAKGNIRATSLKLVTMQAGNGSLVLYPDLPSGLKWNGKKILTSDTIGPYVPIGGELAKGFYGQTTTTVTLTGKGIGTDPFIATWKPPSKAEPSTAAMRTLTSDFGYSETLAATPALIKKLDPYFTGKLNKDTATINGVKLEGSVILSKTSMGIDLVPNISDVLMPMSDAMETLISGYEDDPDHIHPMSVFGIVNATTAIKGLVKLGKKTTATNLALDGGEVAPEAARIKSLEENAVDILQPDIIRVVRFGDSGTGQADVIEANDNNYLVTLAASKYFVLKRYAVPALTFNLVDLFPLDYANNTFYVYVDIVNGAAQYDVTLGQTPETDERTMIGSITTDLDGVVRDAINNVTRLGMFRQLEEHMANPDAHIKKFATKSSIGLDKVENVTTVVDSPAKGAAVDWANNRYATAGWMIEFFSPLSRYRVQKGLLNANVLVNGLASDFITQIKPIALTQITWKPGNLPLPAGLDLYVAFEGSAWTSFGQLR